MIYKESAKGKTTSTHSECKTHNSHKPISSVAGNNNAGTLAKESYKQQNNNTGFQLSALNQKKSNPHSKKDLFNLAKTMVSVFHIELEYKVEKPKYKKLEVMQPTIKTKSELPIGE